jgi:predicted aspartyl protease
MQTRTTDHVLTEATIESLEDLWAVQRGMMPAEQARRVTVSDALVDMEATFLSLPTRLIRQLGLKEQGTRQVRISTGVTETGVYDPVRLIIQGRECTRDVAEVPDDTPVLIGRLALVQLDLVVDLRSRSLVGNPAHGGEHMFELY